MRRGNNAGLGARIAYNALRDGRFIMIGYVTLGTNDLERAAAVYDEWFTVLGAKRLYSTERLIAWGTAPNKAS